MDDPRLIYGGGSSCPVCNQPYWACVDFETQVDLTYPPLDIADLSAASVRSPAEEAAHQATVAARNSRRAARAAAGPRCDR